MKITVTDADRNMAVEMERHFDGESPTPALRRKYAAGQIAAWRKKVQMAAVKEAHKKVLKEFYRIFKIEPPEEM